MDSQAPRQRPDSRIALFAGVLLAALSGCYPYGRMPGYPGPYPYGPQQSHAELLSQGAHQPRPSASRRPAQRDRQQQQRQARAAKPSNPWVRYREPRPA